MATSVGLPFTVYCVGDGTSTLFTFDILEDTYVLSPQTINFLTDKKSPLPISIISASPTQYTAILSGTKVTVTFVTAPPANQASALFLQFVF